MKKLTVLTLLTMSVFTLTACNKSLKVSSEKAPAATTETTVEDSFEEESLGDLENESDFIDEDIEETDSLSDEVIDDDTKAPSTGNTYSVSYGSDFKEIIENSDIDDSLFLRCLIDKDHEDMNYIDVMYQDEYTFDEYCDGVILQSGTDDIFTDDIIFGSQEVNARLMSFMVTDEFEITVIAIPHNEGCYVVETGSYIYGEKNEELGYKVSGAMEEVINSIEFDL